MAASWWQPGGVCCSGGGRQTPEPIPLLRASRRQGRYFDRRRQFCIKAAVADDESFGGPCFPFALPLLKVVR